MTDLGISEEQLDKIKSLINEENQALETEKNEESWLLADSETLNQLANMNNYYLETAKESAQQQIEILKTKEEEIITLERQLQTAASITGK